jgi:hypothetical protein
MVRSWIKDASEWLDVVETAEADRRSERLTSSEVALQRRQLPAQRRKDKAKGISASQTRETIRRRIIANRDLAGGEFDDF